MLTKRSKHRCSAQAKWDWWKASSSRPWGLWLLAFGMYGIVGLISLEGLQLLPVAQVVWSPSVPRDIAAFDLRGALASAILMSAIDNLLNGSMILPLLLVIGGLSTQSFAVSATTTATGQRFPRGVREIKDRPPVRARHFLASHRVSKPV